MAWIANGILIGVGQRQALWRSSAPCSSSHLWWNGWRGRSGRNSPLNAIEFVAALLNAMVACSALPVTEQVLSGNVYQIQAWTCQTGPGRSRSGPGAGPVTGKRNSTGDGCVLGVP